LFKKKRSDTTKKLSETDIFNILEVLIDNIFVVWRGNRCVEGREDKCFNAIAGREGHILYVL
jgi:hypothetical protein